MDDPDFVDFIKMLDEPETAMVKPKPKQEPISISDDEPTMADVTFTCREVMLVDCIKPLAFKHMRGDTFLSNQKLIEILPTEDDVIKIQSMLERDLYVNEMEIYDFPKPANPLLMHHEIHPGKFNLHIETLTIHSLQRILTSP